MRSHALALLLAALPVCVVAARKGNINSFAGPYIAYGDRIYNCDENGAWSLNIRPTHFNPYKPRLSQNITGNVTGRDVVLDDTLWMHAFLDKRNNNQWKENFFVFRWPEKACSMIRTQAPDIYRVLFEGPRMDGPCALPPRIYTFNNEPVRWVFPNVPVLPYGSYRIRVKFGKAKTSPSCVASDCHVIPNPD